MLRPTLRQIEYAIAVAQAGGLSAAAAQLHVSQPALSVALADLETQLGQPLFRRRKGAPMLPTAFGADWLAEARRQVEAMAALFAAPGKRALRLAVFEDLAPMILAPVMAQAARLGLHPQIRPLGFAALSQALAQGDVDAAVTWDLGLPPDMALKPLARMAPRAVLTPDHPLVAGGTLTLQRIAAWPLVLADQDLSIAHWRAVFARQGLTPHIAHRCASLDLMRSFAAHGLGVGLGYAQPAPRISHDGQPFALRAIADAGAEALVLAHPSGAPMPAQIAALRPFLTQLFVPEAGAAKAL